jgi:hypothetical protein
MHRKYDVGCIWSWLDLFSVRQLAVRNSLSQFLRNSIPVLPYYGGTEADASSEAWHEDRCNNATLITPYDKADKQASQLPTQSSYLSGQTILLHSLVAIQTAWVQPQHPYSDVDAPSLHH